MITIEKIEAIPFRLPMHGSLQWGAYCGFSEVRHVLIRVRLSDGSEGFAEAPPRPTIYGETVSSIVNIVQEEIRPRLCGLTLPSDLVEAEYTDQRPVWQAPLAQIRNNHTARGAVDIALHHGLACHLGRTIDVYLGSTQRRIPVSYILGIGDQDTMLAEADRVFAQGVRILKVKVGRQWAEDLRVVRVLRDHFGGEMTLYADANECFTRENARRRLADLAELGLIYCEEPLPVELILAREELRRANVLPIIADDSCLTQGDLVRELSLDTFHILNIKTARTGYSESRQMLDTARRAGKGIMVGSQASSGLGTLAAAYFAALPAIDHPSELSFFLKVKEDILNRPIALRAGYLHLDDLQAIQVDWDRVREQRLTTLA